MVYQIYSYPRVTLIYIVRIHLKAVLPRYLGSVRGVTLRRNVELWVTAVNRSLLSGLSEIKSQEVNGLNIPYASGREINRTHAYNLTPSPVLFPLNYMAHY